jgi:4-aminobutyrate aminotransferase/(S)-3-amino-2-methylpropionate transaminase
MGPPRNHECGLVYETARGVNVVDADGNRYVDFAAGFGAMILGHSHPRIVRTLQEQSERLLLALGDLYPSTLRLALEERLLQFMGLDGWKVMLGQSGSDAITAALKTAMLATAKPGVVAFTGAYHGLGYAPVALCGLREGYRQPFAEQLSSWVEFLPYPIGDVAAEEALTRFDVLLGEGRVGAVVIEPILGRGGCNLPPSGFLAELARRAHAAGALFIADEIWTGLGRAGSRSYCLSMGVTPDIICLGKGLGGGIPISACLGSEEVMKHWRRKPEVVHTATFTGSALACATALTTLELLSTEQWPERALQAGEYWMNSVREACIGLPVVADVRGRGFMIGVDFAGRPGMASTVMFKMLEQGYIVSTGGGVRDVLVLTPPLNIDDRHREPFVQTLRDVLRQFT